MSALPKSWTTVTPFSKALALSMLVVFPVLGFLLGMKYQEHTSYVLNCAYSSFCQPARGGMIPFSAQHMFDRFFWLLPLLLISLILKGYALWIAGKNKQSKWFIAIFIINSLGLLPLIYLLFFKPKKKK